MQKETLKPAYIIEDLCRNENRRSDRSRILLMPAILLGTLALIMGLTLNPWVGLALGLLDLPLIGVEVRNSLVLRKHLRSVRSGQYSVTSETLTGCEEEDVRNAESRNQWEARYVLRFSGEPYCILGDNYTWSRDFRLSYSGMVNTSVIGDEFWVVRPNDTQEIGVVYNKKFFDYCAEDQAEPN